MKGIVALVAMAVLLAGCQTGPIARIGSVWVVSQSQDQFTDVETKMVTVGEGLSDRVIVTQSLKYYPFVGRQGGELFVGIRSGGRYRVPTGTVQVRIDANKAWTITPDETPIYLVPSMPSATMPTGTDKTASANMATFQAQAMQNMTKIMSPYTATTGEKARSILREMVNGKEIKYRTVGFNQAASTTGEIALDASFLDSLKAIGVDPDNL